MGDKLEQKIWWSYLSEDLRELLGTSVELGRRAKDIEGIHDYSFIVFPAAKAYEGFLKNLFLEMGFITKEDYLGKRFRIGKALNPYLEKRIRRQSVYDKLVNFCGGSILADKLWETWRQSRNLVFHWFPNERHALTLSEAQDRQQMVISAIDEAYKECKIK